MKKDILSILDITADDLDDLIRDAVHLKAMRAGGEAHKVLDGKSLAMIFEKPSTRTRVSFEVGMTDLGGHALYLNPHDVQLGRGEEIRDMARVLSRYVSGVMIRAYRHETIGDYASHSTVPVINGLSDIEHPCQVLADIMTIREHFGQSRDVKIAWVGDGNNVCNSLILSTALTGMSMAVARPKGYPPGQQVVGRARSVDGDVTVVESPYDAVMDADVIYTDIWVSMGEEAEHDLRTKAFSGYSISEDLLEHAAPGAVVMHCLPAHRGEEITDAVIEGPQSIVWDQAENRLHAQKALLIKLLSRAEK